MGMIVPHVCAELTTLKGLFHSSNCRSKLRNLHRLLWFPIGHRTWSSGMKWMLVVLVGGLTPVNTNLVFDKFADCLAAEEQMRKHYADAFDARDRSAALNIDRRRDYKRAREVQAKRLLSNVGTCEPHGDGDQLHTATPQQPTTPQPPQPTPQPSART